MRPRTAKNYYLMGKLVEETLDLNGDAAARVDRRNAHDATSAAVVTLIATRSVLLLPPLSQVLQLLRLPLLTVALREHRRARRAPGHDARLLFRVLLPRRLGCKCCSFLLYHSLPVTVAVMHTAARDRQSTHTAAASHSNQLLCWHPVPVPRMSLLYKTYQRMFLTDQMEEIQQERL